jgi:inner membrane protein
MLAKTHLSITLLAVLLFLPLVSTKFIFLTLALVATLIPDLDSSYSQFGHHMIFRPLQLFSKHRGILHSFTLCITISIILAIYLPGLALAFFLGYGLHLFSDSFTKEGIQPFWPHKSRSSGYLTTGSLTEKFLFITFIALDFIALAFFLAGLF